ncbi:MAG: hypothetical protein KAS32_14085 [Candidatus Peribacteraceae bacterium]|nr:hypothetical protein [Candidatus Peribacteraceae bacterium]
MSLTKNQRDIIDHTVHRTAKGLYCGDSKDMQELIKLGYMYSAGKTGFCPDEYFGVTVAGRKALAE